jgi:putative endopeptidase
VSLADVGLDAEAMDRAADPCDDFYQFACGGWIQNTEIPGDKPRWIRSFSEIHKRTEADLHAILASAASAVPDAADGPSSSALMHTLGSYYGSCMDETAVEAAGTTPIAALLALAKAPLGGDRNKTPTQLAERLAQLHQLGIWVYFDIASGQDFRDAKKMIARADQNGLGLPDRDYYLEEDDKSKSLREAYRAHISRMMQLTGLDEVGAKKVAGDVMKVETAIAKISKSRVERRDPEGMYNKIDRRGLVAKAKWLDWPAYLAAMGLADVDDINVTSVPFFEGLAEVAAFATERSSYLSWHVVRAMAGALSRAFVDERFKMAQALTGQKEQRPRFKRCVAATDDALGELLGQPFIAKRFGAHSKDAVIEMFNAIGKAFGREVAKLEWMDEATRSKALLKLEKMAYLIGYPDRWREYDFEVKLGDHGGNTLRARRFSVSYDLGKIGKPVDRGSWFISPPTVNAYYNPLKNQMVFPAGILQPPFFNPKAAVAVNMGAMGMVVGHELTHGFDDQGSQFDGDGNLKSWWEKAVRARFDERTACIEKQYAGYEALPGLKLNGKLTLGENIADAGGVKLAYHAYRALRADASERLVADGLNEDQQFFVSLGQIWCSKSREAFARLRAKTDTHSPPGWRVNGSLQNFPAFAEAFSCKEGSVMRPKNSCSVW